MFNENIKVISSSSTEADEEEGAVVQAAAPPKSKKKAKLINQFNYCERAALTFTNPSRVSLHFEQLKNTH